MKILELQDAGPTWNKYIPVQSIRQFLSLVIILFVVTRILVVLCRGNDDSVAWPVFFFGAAIGSLPALIMALPQIFRVETGSPASTDQLLLRIDELLIFRGFRQADATPDGGQRYVSKLPPWLCWRENEFSIHRQGEAVVVRGPRSSIRWLRNLLVAA